MLRTLFAALFAATLITVSGRAAAPQFDDDASVRAVLDSYLGSVAFPDPTPLDVEIFAAEIEAFWSNGDTHSGRDSVVDAMVASIAEVKTEFESFSAVAKDVTIHRRGDLAWLTCRIEASGMLSGERGAFERSMRSTFVLEKRNERWFMVHEHSSRPPVQK